MPNWCENTLTIEGPNETLKKIKEFLQSENRPFDFNNVIPIPKELLVSAGSTGDSAYEILHEKGGWKRWMEYEWVKKAGIKTKKQLVAFMEKRHSSSKMPPDEGHENLGWRELGNRYASNLKKYGAKNWYDWKVKNWGTKWNAGDDVDIGEGDGILEYTFDTAWSPPNPIAEALSFRFPDCIFILSYKEEGMGFAGSDTYGPVEEGVEA